MRVAIALGGTDRGLSGIGVYVRSVLPRLAARIRALGGSVVVLGTRADLDAYDTGDAEKAMVHDGFDHPAASAAWHLLQVGPAARGVGARVLLLPAANRRMALHSPIPTVAVVHDLAQLRVRKKYDPLRMAYLNHVLTRTLRRATALVAPSRATRDDLARALGISENSIRVVWNGVDIERFAPAPEDAPHVLAARRYAGLEGPYLLYPSRLEHPGKNHIRLLRAFAASRAKDTHTLAFAGKDWGAEGRIRAEIAALGLEQKTKLLGFVPDSVLPGLVAGADAMIMVGLHEGFGLPAIEAIAAGRALVASASGALPEVVGSLAALCDPLDEKAMTQAIDRALYDGDLRARARGEGRDWAARFGWDSTAGGLFDACREVMAA